MDDTIKIPNQDEKSTEDKAINKKANPSDGEKINHQVKDKREIHQPRDNA